MMKNLVSSLVLHERVETTHAKVPFPVTAGQAIGEGRQQAHQLRQARREGRDQSSQPAQRTRHHRAGHEEIADGDRAQVGKHPPELRQDREEDPA